MSGWSLTREIFCFLQFNITVYFLNELGLVGNYYTKCMVCGASGGN
jgi:hypothetical protein